VTESPTLHQPKQRYLPWLVWGGGLFVYVLAIANRTSFGVAALIAEQRFQVHATVLSLFVVVQLIVYAGMQLPAGMALDKWGPRNLLIIGALAMALGQLAMALVPSVRWAIAARVLIGAGDSACFVSAVRLVWDWFPRPRVPLLTQLTGLVGNIGQIISAVPFALALERVGWTPSFSALAVASLVAGAVALLLVRRNPGLLTSVEFAQQARVSRPRDQRDAARPSVEHREAVYRDHNNVASTASPSVEFAPQARESRPRGIQQNSIDPSFRAALRHPGTWLGFFAHMLCGMSSTVFVLIWGVPFMVQGEGYGESAATMSLTAVVLTSLVAAPILGQLTARYPQRRINMALIIGAVVVIGWLIMLIPSQPIPYPVFFFGVVLIAIGGPASLIGLDLAGTLNHPDRRSTVQGLANMGGFIGAIASMLAVGAILDFRTGRGTPVLADYRVALSVVFIPMIIAAIGLLLLKKRIPSNVETGPIIVTD